VARRELAGVIEYYPTIADRKGSTEMTRKWSKHARDVSLWDQGMRYVASNSTNAKEEGSYEA